MTSRGSPAAELGTDSRVVKKSRGKYASRACFHCRSRKLKCSGTHPCRRCLDHSTRCTFSRDAPAQSNEPSPSGHAAVDTVADAVVGSVPAQPQDLSVETRLNNMESALQTLVQLLPRQVDRVSVEPPNADDDGFQGDTTFNAPVGAFTARLATLREQLGCSDTSSTSRRTDNLNLEAVSISSPVSNVHNTISFGSRHLPFPDPSEYARYLDVFFKDVNACHPCVNEPEFVSKCDKIVTTRSASPADVCLLALNYIIFACVDILSQFDSTQEQHRLPGWQWYLAADDLVGKRKISGRGDLGLIQFLVYESFYLIHADKPNAAYNVSGLACRLCFQFGLHQQRLWGATCTPFSRHMRQRLFWTVYFVDRRAAMSCGRPYGIKDSDIDVDQPEWIDDEALFPDRPLPSPDPDRSFNIFLSGITAFARFAGEIWDQAFSATAKADASPSERVAVLDARVQHWLDTVLPTMPLLPVNMAPTQRHLWQDALLRTRMSHLRLLLRRRTMVSLAYSATDGRVCGEVAMDIVRDLQVHAEEARKPTSLRFHMAFSLGGAILILATLLCRDLSDIGIQDNRPSYVESFRLGMAMLREIAAHLSTAQRILQDLRDIINVVEALLDGNGMMHNLDFANAIPPNVEGLFQYGVPGELDPFVGADSFGQPSLGEPFGDEGLGIWESFGNDILWSQNGHGVPWV